MFETHARTKIGINLSFNENDPNRKTQMKQRIFEIVAGGGLLFTEYHAGIEQFFEIDKEIVTFKSFNEFSEKATFLLKNPKIVEALAKEGYRRFLSEHDSKIRLANILEQIRSL
jgi:spore maturation protein CgeB